MSSCSIVQECAAVGVPDPLWGEQVLMWVVLKSFAGDMRSPSSCTGTPSSSSIVPASLVSSFLETLRRHARACIAPSKLPAYFELTTEVPRSSLGKILRAELSQRAASVVAARIAISPEQLELTSTGTQPYTTEELAAMSRLVARSLWEVLKIDLGKDDLLMVRGMTSRGAVALSARLGAEVGVELPATLAFDHPTPDSIVRYLLARKRRQTGVQRPLRFRQRSRRDVYPGLEESSTQRRGSLDSSTMWNEDEEWRLPQQRRGSLDSCAPPSTSEVRSCS